MPPSSDAAPMATAGTPAAATVTSEAEADLDPDTAADLTVAIGHYPEGAGHATRMLAVGKTFERRGADIEIAGGGPGTAFLRANGYEPYEPATIEFIDDYQDGGSIRQVLTRSVPATGRRIRDFARWLGDVDADLFVTDDLWAALGGVAARTPVYFLTHNAPGLYDGRLERVATDFLTRAQHVVSRAFYFPVVWEPCDVDPTGVVRVPPLALDGDVEVASDVDVLLVPSHYSRGFDELADRLRDAGRSVTRVGGDGWETAPSLLPYMRAASVVVCSGYSSIMEAAVAGTPCVINPFTDEQRGVARVIEAHGRPGFAVVEDEDGVVEAVGDPPADPQFDNGADVVASNVLASWPE